MLKLPDFLFCQNTALPGAGLVLSTVPPFFYGKVWRFESALECSEFITRCVNSQEREVFCKLNGYRIVITLAGALDNSKIEQFKSSQQEIVDGMGRLYYEQKVLGKPGFYRKYKQ